MASRLRVRPRHCDAQGMMHAVRYYEFVEDAFLDWLDTRGGYATLRDQGVDLVIKASGCEYLGPARLDDVLEVETRATRVGRTSITMEFAFDGPGGQVARASATYVCVRDGRPEALPPMLAPA